MNKVNPINVVIADDHDIVRRGLKVSIETFDDLRLVGEASNGEDAIRVCRETQPHVLLLDLVMPGTDGVNAIRGILDASPETRIIALTNFKQEKLVQDVLVAGATGYLLKNVSIDELANAIRTAWAGKSVLAPEAAQVLLNNKLQPPPQQYNLTRREQEVLELMVKGLNNREIAETLTISRSTVKNHVSNIFAKLETTSRTEAVAFAVQQKLVE